MQHREAILADGTGVRFITSLSAEAATGTPPATPAPAPSPGTDRPVATEQADPGRCQIELEGGQALIRPVAEPAPKINGQKLTGSQVLGDGDLIEFADGSMWRLVAVDNAGNNGSQA
jgi:hypothetical protein